ncbi:hypothetical protein N1F78_00970 [Seonamhaeicola sp. MEBiC1930]|uniref:hypothetical protein n=1 Tax=Seonamhaeicola sp. MEBiC01930 TaxID=2976768 RepID=UPI003250F497
MRKFSKEEITRMFNEAPKIAPELIDEIYEVLEKDGVEAVNTLFDTKGTFNPNFNNKQAVIDFISIMKKFSQLKLTPKEEAVLNMRVSKN